MALALPPGGRLVACDRDPKSLALARQYWEKAGVADRVSTFSHRKGVEHRAAATILHYPTGLRGYAWLTGGLHGMML